jgi:hypothetical protein
VNRIAPWLVVPALAALLAWEDRDRYVGDLALFARAGRTLHPFASKDVQAGPLQVYGVSVLDRGHALPALAVVAAFALLACAHRLGVRGVVLLGLGVAGIALGVVGDAFAYGHPAETLVPLAWLVAAAEARRGRVVAAGAIVGLSAGLELWGALGIAVLALAPRLRDAARGAVVQVATTLLVFVPFLPGAHTFDYRWQIGSGTLLSHVVAPGTPFGWPLRVAQAALAVGAAVATARVARRSAHAVWLVPLVVVSVRLAIDPVDNPWYWDAPLTLALVGAALVVGSGQELRQRLDRLALLRRRLADGGAEVDQRDEPLVVG